MSRLLSSFTLVTALSVGHASADNYSVPRLPDGTPDLQGVWTNATATPFERASELGTRRAFTDQEAAAIQHEAQARVAADAAPSDPNARIEAGKLPPVGNYNLFWTDRGMDVTRIGGEPRSSMLIDPPNGRLPPLKSAAQAKLAAARGANAEGPEQRSLGERCLLSFGSASGPPMLPVMYNSYYQIVQSAGHVLIQVEMVHDARIIRIGGQHLPSQVRKWMGDSIGRWEGNTLVVETTNFRPDQSFHGSSEHMVVTERFTRVAPDKIEYRFTVSDPESFSTPFTGELAFAAAEVNIYEYACHEGNYALPGILAAEREAEKSGNGAHAK